MLRRIRIGLGCRGMDRIRLLGRWRLGGRYREGSGDQLYSYMTWASESDADIALDPATQEIDIP